MKQELPRGKNTTTYQTIDAELFDEADPLQKSVDQMFMNSFGFDPPHTFRVSEIDKTKIPLSEQRVSSHHYCLRTETANVFKKGFDVECSEGDLHISGELNGDGAFEISILGPEADAHRKDSILRREIGFVGKVLGSLFKSIR